MKPVLCSGGVTWNLTQMTEREYFPFCNIQNLLTHHVLKQLVYDRLHSYNILNRVLHSSVHFTKFWHISTEYSVPVFCVRHVILTVDIKYKN